MNIGKTGEAQMKHTADVSGRIADLLAVCYGRNMRCGQKARQMYVKHKASGNISKCIRMLEAALKRPNCSAEIEQDFELELKYLRNR